MTGWGAEGGRETLTVTTGGTQDSGVGEVHGGARTSGGDTGKSPSAAVNKAGTQGRHGARTDQRGVKGGQQESKGSKTLGVWGDDGGREASEVAHNSPGAGDRERGTRPL